MATKSNKLATEDLKSYSIAKVKPSLEMLINLKIPTFIWGPVGVGKSDLLRQIAAEQERELTDIRLSQIDQLDLRGLPSPDSSGKTFGYLTPAFLPTDPNDTRIIFFDELNCAQPSIQAVAYQLILDRKIGDYTLPEGVAVVAAGNREGDRGITFRMPTPLLNRFVHLEVNYHAKTWQDWAKTSGINSAVIKYLAAHSKDIATFDPTLPHRAFATPRSWKRVSDILNSLTELPKKPGNTYDAVYQCVCGAIGVPVANQFFRYLEIGQYCASLEDIVAGKGGVMHVNGQERLSVLNSICNELAVYFEDSANTMNLDKAVDNDNFHCMVNNAFTYVKDNCDSNKEICLAFISSIFKLRHNINIDKIPSAKSFINDKEVANRLHKQVIAEL
jgi:hypothetical protein